MKAQDTYMDGNTKDYVLNEAGDIDIVQAVLMQLYARIYTLKYTTFWDKQYGSLVNQQNNKNIQKVIKDISNSIQHDVIAPIVKIGYISSNYTLKLSNVSNNGLSFNLLTTDTQGNEIRFPFSVS